MSGQKYRALWLCALMSMLSIAPAAQALSRAERSAVKRINRLRADHGLRALRTDRKLARAADAREDRELVARLIDGQADQMVKADRVRKRAQDLLDTHGLLAMQAAGLDGRLDVRSWSVADRFPRG